MADATKIIYIEDTARLDTLQAGYRKVENALLLLKQDLVDITAVHCGWEGKVQKRCQVFTVFFVVYFMFKILASRIKIFIING